MSTDLYKGSLRSFLYFAGENLCTSILVLDENTVREGNCTHEMILIDSWMSSTWVLHSKI